MSAAKSSPAHVCEVQSTHRKSIQECVCRTCHLSLGFSPRVELLDFLKRLHQGGSIKKAPRAARLKP